MSNSTDLTTIPDADLFREAGRRAKLKQKTERGGAPKGNKNAAKPARRPRR